MPDLAPGELHVWQATVDVSPESQDALELCLSPDERERAARRQLELERRRYVAARGSLRRLLAGYSGTDPTDLCLEYGPNGKPEIAREEGAGALRFNVSHSGPLALFAFTRGAAVGIDLERVRTLTRADRVAARVFPPAELLRWRSLPAEDRLEGFFTRWTRVEAVAKLHGGGVWWLVRHGGSVPAQQDLSVLDLTAPPGYRAAVAVGGRVRTLRQMVLPEEP